MIDALAALLGLDAATRAAIRLTREPALYPPREGGPPPSVYWAQAVVSATADAATLAAARATVATQAASIPAAAIAAQVAYATARGTLLTTAQAAANAAWLTAPTADAEWVEGGRRYITRYVYERG